MTLEQLRAQLKAKREEARAMLAAATDGLTEEQTTQFDSLMAECDTLEANITRLSNLDALDARADAIVPAAARGAAPSSPIRAGGDPANREFESLGHFMAAVRFNPNDSRLSNLYDENAGAEAAANMTPEMRAEMRMDTGASGGFAIPPQFRNQLLELPTYGEAPIRAGATVIEADPNHPDAGITIPALDQSGTDAGHVFGGVTVGWVAEGGQKPLTDMELKSVTVDTYEAAGYMVVTDKLLRNWAGADALIRRQFRNALLQSGEYAFYRGTGTGQPTGILGHPGTISVPRAVAGQVSYMDLLAMVARQLTIGGSAFWQMPRSVLPQIATLKDDNGNFIWKESARDGFAGTLLGYPVKWSPLNPALGTAGDVALIDAAHYIVKDGSGPFVAASEHVLFTQNKTVIKAFWNVGGKPWLTAPHYDEGGYQVSPFVTLGNPAPQGG